MSKVRDSRVRLRLRAQPWASAFIAVSTPWASPTTGGATTCAARCRGDIGGDVGRDHLRGERRDGGHASYISPYISPTSPLYLPHITTCAASDEMAAMPPMERPRKTCSGPGPGLGPGLGSGPGLGLGLEGRRQTIAK